jgi:hypothetical protein
MFWGAWLRRESWGAAPKFRGHGSRRGVARWPCPLQRARSGGRAEGVRGVRETNFPNPKSCFPLRRLFSFPHFFLRKRNTPLPAHACARRRSGASRCADCEIRFRPPPQNPTLTVPPGSGDCKGPSPLPGNVTRKRRSNLGMGKRLRNLGLSPRGGNSWRRDS